MEPTTLTDASTSRWNMSKGTPFRLHESAVFYHQPRRKLLLKKLLVTLNSFNFSNHYKKRWSLQRNLTCPDYRVRYTLFGPFLNHEEIHSFLRGHVPLESCTQVYGESVTLCHTCQYQTYFTHAILSCATARLLRSLDGNSPDGIQSIGNTPERFSDFSTCLASTPSFNAL
jgi:hypothetical protein